VFDVCFRRTNCVSVDCASRSLSLSLFCMALVVLGFTFFAPLSMHNFRSGPSVRDATASRSPNNLDSHLIDPVLVYSTFLGGPIIPSGNQGATATFVDSLGNIYLAGSTTSPSFPITSGGVPSVPVTFVSKIDPNGQKLLFSTYVNGLDDVEALAVDAAGNVYIVGESFACGPPLPYCLPIPAGTTPYQAAAIGRNIGIVELNNTATAVLNAT
jgi:hypothetical protein